MKTREEIIKYINDQFDLVEAEGREVVGFGSALVHSGPQEGMDHATTMVRTLTIHRPLMATPLLGGVEILRARVMDNVTHTLEFE